METQNKTWFEERGFSRNPFSLEPITKEEVKTKAFVNRLGAKEDIKKFIQERSGAIIVLSEIGYGKSSIMNYAGEMANDTGKTVLTIDPRINLEVITFFKSLSQEVLGKILAKQNKLSIDEGHIIRNFVATGNMTQLPTLLQVLKDIFEKNPSVLIMDNLDKLMNFKKHITFLKEILELLPKNIQIVTTGDINQVMNSRIIVSALYSMFDFPITIQEISSIDNLKEFVYGRMEAYSIDGKFIKFNKKIFEILLDRTRGNLREVFRYLSELLKLGKYTTSDLIDAIIKIDMIRLHTLDHTDKKILLYIAGNRKDLKEIKAYLKKENISISSPMLRFRLDELHQNCWTYKGKMRDSKKIIYSAPSVLKHIIKSDGN